MILSAIVFEGALAVLVIIGLFIAARLNGEYHPIVRYLCLAPALAALFTLYAIVAGSYVAYVPDLILLLSTVGIYGVLASKFTDHPLIK